MQWEIITVDKQEWNCSEIITSQLDFRHRMFLLIMEHKEIGFAFQKQTQLSYYSTFWPTIYIVLKTKHRGLPVN